MRRTVVRMATLFGLLVATVAYAQQQVILLPQPRLNTVFPMGGQSGTTIEVTITGNDIENVTELLFSHPGLKAEHIVPTMAVEPEPKSKDKEKTKTKTKTGPVTSAKFKVTIAADVPLGNHDLRLVSPLGLSNPRTFVVGDRPEINESVKVHNDFPDAQRIEIGSTVNAVIASQTDVDYYVFAGKSGQRVLISCQTSSIDSRARPQVEVYDANNRKLGFNRNYKENDALADVTMPADGDYYIRVTEFAYLAATSDYFYRLTLTTGPWIDAIVPPAVNPGKPTAVTLYGRNLPGGKTVPGQMVDGRPVEALTVTVTPPADPAARFQLNQRDYVSPVRALQDGFEYRLKGATGSSNAMLIYVTDLPVVVEKEDGNDKAETAETVTIPCDIAGRIDRRYDKDWYSFTAKKGDVYSIELLAERLGYEMDTFFVVKSAGTLANVMEEQDDDPDPLHPVSFYTRCGDPAAARFVAPADGTYLILVGARDSNVNYGPRCVYRLKISKPAPDFRAIVMAKSRDQAVAPLAYQGGETALDVFVHRQDGFTGPITITAENLPAGVTASAGLIGTNHKWGTIVLSTAASAAPIIAPIIVKCSAEIGGQKVTRSARPATITWSVQPGQNIPTIARLDQSLLLAVRPAKAHMRISSDITKAKIKSKDKEGKESEVAALSPLYVKAGDKLALPLLVTWQGEEARANPVTITLEATQAITQTAPLSITAPVTLAKDKNDGSVVVDVKTTAVPGRYAIVLRGDSQISIVRDPSKKDQKSNATVTGFTQPIELTVLPASLGKLTVTPPPTVKAGASAEFVVKLDRLPDQDGEVKVSVAFPKEQKSVTIADAVIPAGANEVKMTVKVAADAKSTTLSNLQVSATATLHGKFAVVSESKMNVTITGAK